MTRLRVTDDEDDGKSFFEAWTAEHGSKDATIQAETEKVGRIIEWGTDGKPLVVIGATDRGLLARVVSESPVMVVVTQSDFPVT